MPTYEYACKSCGHHLEVVQSFTEDPLTVCPSCSGSLRKVFGNIGISFKGSGFYKNDSRESTKAKSTTSPGTETKATGTDSGSSGSAAPGSGSGGSSESKSSESKPAPAAAAS